MAATASLISRPAGLQLGGLSLARLVGFAGLASLLVVLVSVVALSFYEREKLEAQAEQETRNTAFFLADHANRLFVAADFALQETARHADGLAWEDVAASRALWQDLKGLVKGLPYIFAIFLSDEDGDLQLTTAEFPTPRSNSADRDWFVSQLEPNDDMYIGHVVVGRISGKPTFVITRRLTATDGTFRGVVAASAELAYFDGFWSRLESRFEPRVTLFRAEDFDVLAQQPPAKDGPGFLPAQVAALADVIARSPQSGTTLIGSDAPDGKARILSYERVGDFPLYLSVGVRQEAIDAVWRSQVVPYFLFGAAAVAALAALTVFAFRQARRDAQSRTELARTVEERTAALTAATTQLQTLLDELNHRVKNNLQVVTSLLRLQSQRSDDALVRAALDDSIRRIQAMALLHQQLSLADAPSDFSFGAYLQQLAAKLADAYGVSGRISVEVEADGTCLNLETATPVALILNEVISNALKYAFADGQSGRILVRLSRLDGRCELTVEDDGAGLPPTLDWRTGGGLGMRIVRALVGQIGGTADYQVDGGTRFCLRFAPTGGSDRS